MKILRLKPISYMAKQIYIKLLQNQYKNKKLPITIFRIFQAYGLIKMKTD